RLHQELAAKQTPPDHQVGGLPLLRRRFLFSEVSRRTSAGTLVPAQGTVALHCPVARLVSESFLMLLGPYRYPSRSANQICPEPRLKFVLMVIVRNLKNSFVFVTLAFLTACQTPQASNQQDRPARNGQSSSPSSQYEVEPISGIQRPLGAPGTFRPGSGRGP